MFLMATPITNPWATVLFLLVLCAVGLVIRANMYSGSSTVEKISGILAAFVIVGCIALLIFNSDTNSPASQTCPNCDKGYVLSDNYCSECGASLLSDSDAALTCNGCGTEIRDDAKFCSNCGEPQTIE